MTEQAIKKQLVVFASGGIAGSCEILVTMPLDSLKNRMQMTNASLLTASRSILAENGVRSFYNGLSAMLLQVSLKAAIRFTAYESLKSSGLCNAFTAGVGAGIIEAALWVTPTERLKVLRQANPSVYGGLVSGTRAVIADGGVANLWVGVGPTAARQAMAMGIRFGLYDTIKGTVVKPGEKATPLQSLGAGMLTGTISACANQPIDTAKTRIQAAGGRDAAGLMGTMQQIVSTQGPAALYAGSFPRIARLTIGQGIIFSCQEHIARAMRAAAGLEG